MSTQEAAVPARAFEKQRRSPTKRVVGALPFIGPAFVAAIAYVDPGNFATNIAGGAKYGYLLLWVILAANLMAMLIQFLSAKVGIATGRSASTSLVTWPLRNGLRPSPVRARRPRSERSTNSVCTPAQATALR